MEISAGISPGLFMLDKGIITIFLRVCVEMGADRCHIGSWCRSLIHRIELKPHTMHPVLWKHLSVCVNNEDIVTRVKMLNDSKGTGTCIGLGNLSNWTIF